MYIPFPLSNVAPSGSKTPVLILVSFAIDFIIAGLNWGSENKQFTFSCSITSLISDNCWAPGKISGFTVKAPKTFIPNLFSKYLYASWNTTNLKSFLSKKKKKKKNFGFLIYDEYLKRTNDYLSEKNAWKLKFN